MRNFTNGEVPLSRMWRSRRFLGRWLSLFDAPRDIGRYNERRGNMYERTVASVGKPCGLQTFARCELEMNTRAVRP